MTYRVGPRLPPDIGSRHHAFAFSNLAEILGLRKFDGVHVA